MSQEDIEIIRRAYADLNRRDVEAWLDAFHSNAEITTSPADPKLRRVKAMTRCASGSRQWTRSGRTAATNRRSSSTPATLLSSHSASAPAGDVRAPFDMPLFHVFELRNGRIQRGTAYLDKAEALEAAGLSA